MKAIVLAAAAATLYPSDRVFAWRDGAIYQVTARPGRVTDIALQPGESLGAVNPVAAGDTARWIVGDSESGSGAAKQVHLLVKPVDAGLATNLLIATDRRTYHVELRSTAGAYMATVSWRYPPDELVALKSVGSGVPAQAGTHGPSLSPSATQLPGAAPAAPDLTALNFNYRLEGRAAFRPVRVYDDGRRTIVEFPPSISTGEMPPLFVMSADGKSAELVNYRVVGRRMVVDRLFDAAELRLGEGSRQARVRIVRDPASAQ